MDTHPKTLAKLASEYYLWFSTNSQAAHYDFPKYNEVRAIGKELYSTGGKRAMLKAFLAAKAINPQQIWIISKMWDRIGNIDGEIDEVWLH